MDVTRNEILRLFMQFLYDKAVSFFVEISLLGEFGSKTRRVWKSDLYVDMNEVKQEEVLESGIYRHFKGMQYEVLDVALCSETQIKHVVYRALYGERALWIRPVEMFIEQVERGDYTGPRFTLVS